MDSTFFMNEAFILAREAEKAGEVPVGAVVVDSCGKIIGRGSNCREIRLLPTAHAEIIAIEEASRTLKNWRLTGCTLYVTLEPCLMCAGAIINSRIQKVVFATPDPKAGAVESLYRVFDDKRLNHQVEYSSGVLQEECSKLLSNFFKSRRQAQK